MGQQNTKWGSRILNTDNGLKIAETDLIRKTQRGAAKLKLKRVSSLVMHLVEDDDERDDEGVVDARVDGDAVRVLPQQRAHHAEPPVDLQASSNPFSRGTR